MADLFFELVTSMYILGYVFEPIQNETHGAATSIVDEPLFKPWLDFKDSTAREYARLIAQKVKQEELEDELVTQVQEDIPTCLAELTKLIDEMNWSLDDYRRYHKTCKKIHQKTQGYWEELLARQAERLLELEFKNIS